MSQQPNRRAQRTSPAQGAVISSAPPVGYRADGHAPVSTGRDARQKTAHFLGPVSDAPGFDLKPDPLAAQTRAELVAALRTYRVWSGEPSFRAMASRARQEASTSSMCTALKRDDLPPMRVVMAIIIGCGGSKEDQELYATAWRRLKLGIPDTRSPLRVVQSPPKDLGNAKS